MPTLLKCAKELVLNIILLSPTQIGLSLFIFEMSGVFASYLPDLPHFITWVHIWFVLLFTNRELYLVQFSRTVLLIKHISYIKHFLPRLHWPTLMPFEHPNLSVSCSVHIFAYTTYSVGISRRNSLYVIALLQWNMLSLCSKKLSHFTWTSNHISQ